jgi:hypothetical protein
VGTAARCGARRRRGVARGGGGEVGTAARWPRMARWPRAAALGRGVARGRRRSGEVDAGGGARARWLLDGGAAAAIFGSLAAS